MPTGRHVREALQRAVDAHAAAHSDHLAAAGLPLDSGGVTTGATAEEDEYGEEESSGD